MNHLKSKHHLYMHLFNWLSKEIGTKAAYTNTKDQHCKSMLYYPLEQNQNTCKGPLKRGTLYYRNKIVTCIHMMGMECHLCCHK